ncbi:carbohydrate porin [Thiocapsa bogorovii]|uniref:carbohydrate porin n=1 Tax=Thiocapsa bogorovii TaxID=521689 RepID=UPI001E31436D|nr:carbohydrate porin [Thiocapsa bogorovii]UHD17734.1 carbohydrate porin [Thiocapsa bogorovii]
MYPIEYPTRRGLALAALASGLLATFASPSRAYELNDRVSLGAVLAAAGQCQEGLGGSVDADGQERAENSCRGGMPFQLALDVRPSARDELYVLLGFAVEDGLNAISPFVLAPWAVDLEDDLQDINGRGRDHLLQVWYKHTFTLGEDATLGTTFGIIDSTAYLDENAYANDEFTQFMNEAFVNSGGFNLPSYDAGAALELALGDWEIKVAALNIGENDDGNNYNFWGAQLGYRLATALGEGQYRAVMTGTSTAFFEPRPERGEETDGPENAGPLAAEDTPEKTDLMGYGLSFDQALGDRVGAFLRLAWTDHQGILDYRGLYTGGLQLGGGLWGREADTVGIAYGYLDGADTGITNTNVAELYYRFAANDVLALTADIQYMADAYDSGEDIDGWIFGMRLVAEL